MRSKGGEEDGIDADDTERVLLLDEMTGMVHKYEPGRGDDSLCDCDLLHEAYDVAKITIIRQRHLSNGIWGRAECYAEAEKDQESQ